MQKVHCMTLTMHIVEQYHTVNVNEYLIHVGMKK